MSVIAKINARQSQWAKALCDATAAGDTPRAARIWRLWNERNRRAAFGLAGLLNKRIAA